MRVLLHSILSARAGQWYALGSAGGEFAERNFADLNEGRGAHVNMTL